MSINNLFLQLRDIQYQADKLLKSKHFNNDLVERFASNSYKLRKDLIQLDLDDELLIHAEDIEQFDFNYKPDPDFVDSFVNFLSFGFNWKAYIEKKREEYFRMRVRQTKHQFACIEQLLREL